MSDEVTIIPEVPPNIDAIRARFPISGQEIFAWAGTIYNPSNNRLPVWLVEHEKVHFRQQAEVGGPENWWAQYIEDDEFRLEQELEAHRREYRVFCRLNKDRNVRARYLMEIAARLAAPMYGKVIEPREAARRIRS